MAPSHKVTNAILIVCVVLPHIGFLTQIRLIEA